MSERLAIVDIATNAVVGAARAGTAARFGSGVLVSPAFAGWTDGKFRMATLAPFVAPPGETAIGGPSYSVGPDLVTETYATEAVAPATPRIMGYEVVKRIEDALGLESAKTAIAAVQASDPVGYARLISAPDGVPVDDPRLVAGVRKLGLDPALILGT